MHQSNFSYRILVINIPLPLLSFMSTFTFLLLLVSPLRISVFSFKYDPFLDPDIWHHWGGTRAWPATYQESLQDGILKGAEGACHSYHTCTGLPCVSCWAEGEDLYSTPDRFWLLSREASFSLVTNCSCMLFSWWPADMFSVWNTFTAQLYW